MACLAPEVTFRHCSSTRRSVPTCRLTKRNIPKWQISKLPLTEWFRSSWMWWCSLAVLLRAVNHLPAACSDNPNHPGSSGLGWKLVFFSVACKQLFTGIPQPGHLHRVAFASHLTEFKWKLTCLKNQKLCSLASFPQALMFLLEEEEKHYIEYKPSNADVLITLWF